MPKTRPHLRIATVVCVPLLAAAGCITPPTSRDGRWTIGGDDLDPRRKRTLEREPAKSAHMARKVVVGKAAPTSLLAADGTRCIVTAKRYEETKEGDKVTCRWDTAP